MALGSDYPFPLGEIPAGTLINKMDLPTSTKEQLFYKTALDWLDLKKEQFE